MNILCCFKISPDYDKVVEKDWAAVGSNGPDTSYVPRGPGCYDEAALELALRLRDGANARGEAVRVTAATAADTAPAAFARQLYALGVTDAVPETIEASLQLSEAALVGLGKPMGPVIASIHERRDEFRKALQEAAKTAGQASSHAVKRKA